MPTTTVYANRAGTIDSRRPNASASPSALTGLELSWIAQPYGDYNGYLIEGVYGFNVPSYLYGKQVLSGYVRLSKNNSYHVAISAVRPFRSPDEFDLNKVTDKTAGRPGEYRIRGSYKETTLYYDGAADHIAWALSGVRVWVPGEYVNRSERVTITAAPSVTIEYRDEVIPVLTQKEIEGYHNPKEVIKLPYNLYENIIGRVNISAIKVRWRKQGESGYSEVPLAVEPYIFQQATPSTWFYYCQQPVPPNTFPVNAIIEWQLQLQVNGQWWSQNTAWNTFSTVDSISNASPVEPVNAMLDVEVENTFRWRHVIATGSAPTGYELQYSVDGYNWRALAARTGTAETSCVVAANTLPAGKLQWRVRTLNGDGIAGTWSEPAAIIGYGAPPAPIISEISNTARPTIRWQSDTQIAYELIIRQGDKELLHVGETAGTDKAYTVADFLADGAYTVLVRIENSGLYWSQWASAGFTIQTQKPAPPVITGQPVQNGVMVMTAEVPDALYLLRDGVSIAKLFGGQAVDYGAVGPHEYVVRRVNAAGAFADSTPLVLETKVEQAVIAPADDPGSVIGPLLQAVENEYPSTANLAAEMKHYAGRRYPVAVTAGAIEEEFSPVLAAMNPAHWRALRGLMEEAATVLYRNSAGDCAYCLIIALNPTKAYSGYMTWETTLTRVDYVERIEYDEVI